MMSEIPVNPHSKDEDSWIPENRRADPISVFLYDVYGYSAIQQFLTVLNEGRKAELEDIIEGTLFGTFRREAVNPNKKSTTVTKRVYRPGVPKVRTTQEALDEEAPYVVRNDLPFHIRNLNLFGEYDGPMVAEFVERNMQPIFPNALHNFTPGKTRSHQWTYTVESDKFGFYIQGSSKSNYKSTYFDFDAPQVLIEDINVIVQAYTLYQLSLRG